MVFDSDVLIWASRGYADAAAFVQAEEDRTASIATVIELLQGARSKSDLHHIRQFFSLMRFRILPLTESIGQTAAALVEEHTLSTGLQLADALIASTALESDEVLATANIKHFRGIRRLKIKTFRPALR